MLYILLPDKTAQAVDFTKGDHTYSNRHVATFFILTYITCISVRTINQSRIMQTKLTLRLERDLIERAKRYARARGTSVSQIVANYFQALTAEEEDASEPRDHWKQDLPPITRSLVGLAAGSNLDEEDYRRYLEEKHR